MAVSASMTPFAVARIVAAAILALLAGWLVGRAAVVIGSGPADTGACHAEPQIARRSPGVVIKEALRFGFGEAVDHSAAWILLGLGIAALVSPYLDKDWLVGVPPFLQVACAAILGLPLYVCASGSTPLAAMLVANGVSPGAAIALLLTGPATNVTTFGLLSDLHGRKTAITFGVLIMVGAIGLGNISAHEQGVLQYASERLQAVEGLRIIGQAREKASIISFVIDGIHAHDLGTFIPASLH